MFQCFIYNIPGLIYIYIYVYTHSLIMMIMLLCSILLDPSGLCMNISSSLPLSQPRRKLNDMFFPQADPHQASKVVTGTGPMWQFRATTCLKKSNFIHFHSTNALFYNFYAMCHSTMVKVLNPSSFFRACEPHL